MNAKEYEKSINQYMKTRTPLDVTAVYEILKDRFPLTLTHTFALENGEKDYDGDYTMVCGMSSAGAFQLYDNGLYGVFDVDKADPADMEAYYSVQEQEKYGVVGIELKIP